MIKSGPSMMKMLNKILALLFLVLFFASSFTQVSAQVVTPICSFISVTPSTVDASTATLNVRFNAASGLSDDTTFQFVYSATGDATDFFSRSIGEVNWNTNFDFDTVLNAPQSVYLQASGASGGQTFCQANIVYDPVTKKGSVGVPGAGMPASAFDLCKQTGDRRSSCDTCFKNGGIWSGVGCIPFTSQSETLRALLTIGLGITGTVVVLMTLYAGFMLSTSQGDPKRVDEAKAAVTSAIAGAFFLIFSVTILRFIGVTILKIPGFG